MNSWLLLASLLSSSVVSAFGCLCQLRHLSFRCSSAKCYDERVANDFCRSDFCVEASVRSDRQYSGHTQHNTTYASYQFRPVRVLRFTPASLAAIKTSLVFTPAETNACGVHLKKGSIYFFCGQMIGQKAVITACHYVKRTETLNLAERSFFITGYKNTNCFPQTVPQLAHKPMTSSQFKPPVVQSLPPLTPIHAPIVASNFIPTHKPVTSLTLPTLRPIVTTKTTATPESTTTAAATSATSSDTQTPAGPPGPPGSPANGDYFCLLVPINALSLNRFLKYSQMRDGAAVDPNGQYVLYCPNLFFCIPQTSQLHALSNITALEVRTAAEDEAMERMAINEDFKAVLPKPLLPMCRDFNETTFIMPPWLIPALSVLQSPANDSSPPPCSDTNIDLDCALNVVVSLPDGTSVSAAPIQEPAIPTVISTPDGTTIAIIVGKESRITALDSTEATLLLDGSSNTVLPDGTLVAISVDKNVMLNMSDGARVVFNQSGMSVSLPDGTVVVTSEYGMVVTTADGHNTLIPVDSHGAEMHQNESEVIVTEGLHAEIRARTGTQVLITPTDTTIGGRDGGTTNILPDGTVTVTAPGGLSLTFSTELYVNVTTSDGTAVSVGQDDSAYAINEMEAIVVFPNGNEMIFTKDEIISIESDGDVTVTDSLGSNPLLPLDKRGVVCEDFSCLET